MLKPKVFISSTIIDFSDLRSALKYWLESFGFSVMLSEFNDFEKGIDENTFQACLDTLSTCNYYILLIGNRKGGYFDKINEISITQREYKEAFNLFQKGQLKLVMP